ncbi:MAG: DUF3368 domain-containing protein [Anaerolineae bacterium]
MAGTATGPPEPPDLRFYADATALIALARIGRLDLLTLLPQPICVTRRVWDEVTGNQSSPGAELIRLARETGLLALVAEGDPAAFPRLDAGGSTVLSAAAACHGAVLIDERKARALIKAETALRGAIRAVTGVVGLVLLAKRRGYIAAARPVLDSLASQGSWLSAEFLSHALRQAGEE